MAFEDPDGDRAKELLAAEYLDAFGTRASVKKWKLRTNKSQTSNSSQLSNFKHKAQTPPGQQQEAANPKAQPPARGKTARR